MCVFSAVLGFFFLFFACRDHESESAEQLAAELQPVGFGAEFGRAARQSGVGRRRAQPGGLGTHRELAEPARAQFQSGLQQSAEYQQR